MLNLKLLNNSLWLKADDPADEQMWGMIYHIFHSGQSTVVRGPWSVRDLWSVVVGKLFHLLIRFPKSLPVSVCYKLTGTSMRLPMY